MTINRRKVSNNPLTSLVCGFFILLTTACGGPLAYTIKMSEVPAEKRDGLTQSREAADKAELARNAAEELVVNTEKEIELAEQELKKVQADLAIAKEMLDLEEAKEDADRSSEVKTAETRVEQSKNSVEVAEAQLALKKELLSHRENLAREAKAAWLVTLAEHEAAKMAEVKTGDPEMDERRTKINEQLVEKKQDLEKAKARSKESNEEVKEAEAEVADALDA